MCVQRWLIYILVKASISKPLQSHLHYNFFLCASFMSLVISALRVGCVCWKTSVSRFIIFQNTMLNTLDIKFSSNLLHGKGWRACQGRF